MCGYRKWYLLMATVITGAIGIAMICLGKKKRDEAVFLDAFLSDHIHVGRTFIGLGILLFIIAFVGIAGLSLHANLLLQAYAYLMLALVVTQIIVGITIFTRMGTIRNTLNKTLEENFRTYDKHKAEIDELQKVISCCGMSGPKNWKIKELPPSCCGLEKGGLYCVGIICFCLVFYELKCVALACCMSDPCTVCLLCSTLFRPKERPKTEGSSGPPTSQESLLQEK